MLADAGKRQAANKIESHLLKLLILSVEFNF